MAAGHKRVRFACFGAISLLLLAVTVPVATAATPTASGSSRDDGEGTANHAKEAGRVPVVNASTGPAEESVVLLQGHAYPVTVLLAAGGRSEVRHVGWAAVVVEVFAP